MNKTLKTVISAVALAGTCAAAPAFANSMFQEDWGSEVVAMQKQADSSLTRAEVKADMELWQQAGLQNANTGEGARMNSPQYQQRLAEYQRLRSGPAYLSEVQRQGGDVDTIAVYERTYLVY